LRFIDPNGAAIEFVAIQSLARFFGCLRGHGDEAKTADLARFPVRRQEAINDFTILCKERLDGVLRRVKGQVSHVEFDLFR
jgi:hypothetical protein